jgi:hypothetical protein
VFKNSVFIRIRWQFPRLFSELYLVKHRRNFPVYYLYTLYAMSIVLIAFWIIHVDKFGVEITPTQKFAQG